MKVILSRKGFDSAAGGYPSPILPDSTLLSLPVPDKQDSVRYNDLRLGNKTYLDLMKERGIEPIRKHEKIMTCHLDPDIRREVINRKEGWLPVFGQSDKAQSHLDNQKVGKDDIFLFFGWFRRYPDGEDRHVIFGYLQVGEKHKVAEYSNPPEWILSHPHMIPQRRLEKFNTVFVARETLSWNDRLPGAGVFKFDKSLVLTKDGQSRSIWNLPGFFRDAVISYHHDSSRWKNGCLETCGRGQEFVIDNEKVEAWAKKLIETNILSN